MGGYFDGFYYFIAHFIPMCTTYQALDIARVFISEIMRLHGVPKRIISDRGSVYWPILDEFPRSLGNPT
jgi:hypothetical protein